MFRPRQFAFLCFLIAAFSQPVLAQAAAASRSSPSPSPAIRVRTNLVYVGVNVTDSHGRFVPGLRRRDFEIFDNGVRQPIADFASDDSPAEVVLLIEDGLADFLMEKIQRSLLVDAGLLVGRLPPQDRVAVLTYAGRTEVVSGFTADKRATRLVLARLNDDLAAGGVASGSLDLSASLAATLDWLSVFPGPKTIVLFSTGFDSTSPQAWQAVRSRIAASDVRILAVSSIGDLRSLPKRRHLSPDDRDERAFVNQGIAAGDQSLAQLSSLTGGRAYFPKNGKDFARVYSQIFQQIRGQYTLAFAPASLDGRLHSLAVKVKRRGCRVGHRQAYLAALAP